MDDEITKTAAIIAESIGACPAGCFHLVQDKAVYLRAAEAVIKSLRDNIQ